MHEFKIFALIILPLLLMVSGCAGREGPSGGNPPNIIYILADDLGIGDLSCYGQEKYTTPNIDDLARNGIRFSQHYSGSTVCAPSRSVLLTGQHTGHTPVRGNTPYVPLPDSSVTVAELLKTAGYATGVFGKWSLGLLGNEAYMEGYPTNQGFDVFSGYDNQSLAHRYYPNDLRYNESVVPLEGNDGTNRAVYAPDLIFEHLLNFIDDHKNQPFFIYYATIIPHAELIVPDDSLFQKYRGKFEEIPYTEGNDYGDADFNWKKYCSQDYPNATFAAMVARLDRYVGMIVEKLKDEGLLKNTLIIFTSENGAVPVAGRDIDFFNSTAGLRGFKRDLFEGGIRAPMIAFWQDRIKQGSETDHISAHWDVLPTLAEVAGIEIPANIDGISYLPVLLGESDQREHDHLYWEYPERGGIQAVRKNNWKAVRVNVTKESESPIMLFDLEKDPYETTDVSADFPEVVDEMQRLMKSSRIRHPRYHLVAGE